MEKDLNQICDELLVLLTDYLERGPRVLRRITDIGEQLNQEGGMTLMRKVGSMVREKDQLKASWLNNAWDGIGYWMS